MEQKAIRTNEKSTGEMTKEMTTEHSGMKHSIVQMKTLFDSVYTNRMSVCSLKQKRMQKSICFALQMASFKLQVLLLTGRGGGAIHFENVLPFAHLSMQNRYKIK